MKQILALLAFVLVAFTGYSQYIYNDFDANQNHEFSGWPNIPEVIANPDPSGINTSAHVAKFIRSGEQWAHSFAILPGKVNFETGTTFKLKVWSPIVCQVLFKLEDQANGAISTEVMGNVTTANQWVEIQYNFSGSASELYDKLVIFFDFATTTDNTFYFDDVEGPEYGGGTPVVGLYFPVTFDDPQINYALTDFGGNDSEIVVDPTNANNHVVKTIKTATAELWAGTTVGGTVGFADPIPFEEGYTSMSVRVWSPTAGTPMRLKVEKSTDPTISVETEANSTVANAWQTLVFDFSNEAPGTAQLNLGYDYNKASMFFNFGTTGAQAGEQTYFWDDMHFMGPTSIFENQLNKIQVYPNPASDVAGISGVQNITETKIINIAGQTVAKDNSGSSNLDVSSLPAGIYSILVTDKQGNQFIGKLIKD